MTLCSGTQLPEAFASDAEREAQVPVSLNQPNICALMMELIRRQTLMHRIKAGPIPLEDMLQLRSRSRRRSSTHMRKGSSTAISSRRISRLLPKVRLRFWISASQKQSRNCRQRWS
jgi:hypothetical protein